MPNSPAKNQVSESAKFTLKNTPEIALWLLLTHFHLFSYYPVYFSYENYLRILRISYLHYVLYVVLYACKEKTIQMRFREIEKQLLDDGWSLVDVRGSHHQYKHPTKSGKVTIPNHRGDIPQRVVNSILKQAGLK